jgi:uncharacterized membrane protein
MPGIQPKPRRNSVIASGLLCGVLALVVLYTKRSAFFSPLAVVVLAAIGAAAVLLQLRLRNRGRAPMWLNILGILLAGVALFSDRFSLTPPVVQLVALGSVGSFAVSSAVILHAFRKGPDVSK